MEATETKLPHENLSGPDDQTVPVPVPVQEKLPADTIFQQLILGMSLNVTGPEQSPGPNPLPIKRLTPKLAGCIRTISKQSEISDGMVLGVFLTGVSAIFLPSTTVRTFYGKEIGLNIFAQTNAPSSSRKTDMYNPLLNLLHEHDKNRRKCIDEINKNLRHKREAWKVRADALKKQLKKASTLSDNREISILEENYLQHLKIEPTPMPELSVVQGDSTPAAIMQALFDNLGCSSLFIDEGVLLYHKILNTEIHHINTAWSGAVLDKTTIRGGNLYIEKPRLSSHTFLQNDVFKKLTQGKSFSFLKNSGYFSRVLICEPKTTQESNEFPEFKGSEDELNQLLLHLKSQLLVSYPLDGLFSGEIRTLKLSAEAENLARSYYVAIQGLTNEDGIYQEMQAFCGKAAEHVHRLAGLIHCIEQDETDTINYASVSAAIVIFDWYVTEHWRSIVKEGRPLNTEMAAEKLIQWMKNRKDRYQVEWVSRVDIPRRVECFRGEPVLLDDVIRYLQQSGDIDTNSGRRKGQKGGARWHDIRLSSEFPMNEKYRERSKAYMKAFM